MKTEVHIERHRVIRNNAIKPDAELGVIVSYKLSPHTVNLISLVIRDHYSDDDNNGIKVKLSPEQAIELNHTLTAIIEVIKLDEQYEKDKKERTKERDKQNRRRDKIIY